MKINDYRHSASKGNDWYNNPSQWIYRHLLGNRSETTPRMGMGNSAELPIPILGVVSVLIPNRLR